MGDSMRLLGKGALVLARGYALRKEEGARFSNRREQRELFSGKNRGLLIDGNKKRISEKDSFAHLAVIAKPGGGKTTAYIIPNIIDCAQKGDSIVALDPSGELFEKTGSFLQKQGYQVHLIDPLDSKRSVQFNPYYGLGYRDLSEIRSISASLILSRYGNAKEPLWNDGAISLIFFFAKCFAFKKETITVPAIYSKLLQFGSDGSSLDDWVAETEHPENSDDESLSEEWKGIISTQEKMLASYCSIAKTALSSLTDDSIKWLLSDNDLDFKEFRKRKSILYISFPAHKQEDYQFLIDTLYVRLFSTMMEQIPKRSDLSVFCLLDEFGSSYVKDFPAIINNIRKYRVSLSLVMQSIAQLRARYGATADAIKGGIGSYVVFAGADNVTAHEISDTIGRKISIERNRYSDVVRQQRENNLLNPDQIRTLGDRQAVFLSKNRYAVIVDLVPYWDNPALKRLVKS